jgi:hypothetical protein
VEGREDSMVWLVGGSENGKKRRKCSVRFACMQDLKEGLSNAAEHDLCTYISYRDTTAFYHFRRGGPTNGGSLARQTKDRPLMPAHMPWPRDALDTRKSRCGALINLVVWGRASISLHPCTNE